MTQAASVGVVKLSSMGVAKAASVIVPKHPSVGVAQAASWAWLRLPLSLPASVRDPLDSEPWWSWSQACCYWSCPRALRFPGFKAC